MEEKNRRIFRSNHSNFRQRCGRRREEELRIHKRIVNKLVVGSGKHTDKIQGLTLQPLKTFKPLKSS